MLIIIFFYIIIIGQFSTLQREKGKKGRDLIQSYAKYPYTNKIFLKAKWQHINATKTSITQWLQTDLGRSVGSNGKHPTGVVKRV